jgi:hypothetical protein
MFSLNILPFNIPPKKKRTRNRDARFFLAQQTKTRKIYQNCHQKHLMAVIYTEMALKITNALGIYQHFHPQFLQKFTKFGTKKIPSGNPDQKGREQKNIYIRKQFFAQYFFFGHPSMKF